LLRLMSYLQAGVLIEARRAVYGVELQTASRAHLVRQVTKLPLIVIKVGRARWNLVIALW
jgi:hypothetical protein